jgi:tyrosine-protein kinase
MSAPTSEPYTPSVNGSHEPPAVPTVAERLDRLIDIARRRWLLVVSVIVWAAAGGVLASGGQKEYSATSKVLLSDSPIIASADQNRSSTPGDPERDTNTQVGLITIGTVADRVQQRLGLHLSQKALIRKVTATPEGTTNIVDVTATDASPARARAIANGFADEYVAFRERVARSSVDEGLRGVRRQLASLSASQAASAQGAALKSRLHDLQIASAGQTGGAQVVFRATTPATPNGPHRLRSGVLAAVAGLMLALAIVTVLELRGMRRRDEDRVESPWIMDDAELPAMFPGARSADQRPDGAG